MAAAESRARGRRGRVLLRASGTEPLVRVMVEAPDEDVAQQVVDAWPRSCAGAGGAGAGGRRRAVPPAAGAP